MDEQLITLGQQLQSRIERLEAHADEGTLLWVHSFLRDLIDRMETATPELKAKRLRRDLNEASRILNELTSKMVLERFPDSLEQTERALGGEEPYAAGPAVPAKRRPGPKGLSGGVALPLP